MEELLSFFKPETKRTYHAPLLFDSFNVEGISIQDSKVRFCSLYRIFFLDIRGGRRYNTQTNDALRKRQKEEVRRRQIAARRAYDEERRAYDEERRAYDQERRAYYGERAYESRGRNENEEAVKRTSLHIRDQENRKSYRFG